MPDPGAPAVSVLSRSAIVTRPGDGPSRQPEGEGAAVVGGGTDVGRPEVSPELVDVPDGVGTSVGLPVVVRSPVGVGCPRVVSGAGVVVVVGALGGAVVAVGTGAPPPAGAALVVSGRM
jgi:hypothetical protein